MSCSAAGTAAGTPRRYARQSQHCSFERGIVVRGLPLLLGAVAIAFAGCSNNNNNNPGQCSLPSGTQTVLVYPAPGATAIPDNFGLVVLGSTSALPSSYGTYVVNNTTQNAGYFNNVGTPPNPLPTPNALPTFAAPVYQSSGNPGVSFVAGSSISVYLNNTSSNCVPTLLLGSFTVK